ncbi:DUF4381 domain-containing protein [Shewanella surugensis]|uniref:DUF4381 domain-containing protein n=1 Tax=Shewanella surugensis TaxID=212020 RepID=A0ABT0LD80_9GAMM|nr:DUF4381 domain-containing protein [Shewanella surugensis]MCL1125659.1 DUF4381 domain-containing protein [Shewanella surugensis]
MSVTPNPALANLKDIHLPSAIGDWPFAYGYWIIIAIALTLLLMIAFYTQKHYQCTAAKRAALQQLAQLDPEDVYYAIEINGILKRAAMSYLPRAHVAGLEGQAWYNWLNAQDNIPQLSQLLDTRYQQEALSPSERLILKKLTKKWLSSALPLTQTAKNNPPTESTSGESLC